MTCTIILEVLLYDETETPTSKHKDPCPYNHLSPIYVDPILMHALLLIDPWCSSHPYIPSADTLLFPDALSSSVHLGSSLQQDVLVLQGSFHRCLRGLQFLPASP
eukprot:TRINITY_DN12438_c1_g3_i2.p1 TRINITY_DN12438_c1_g3~~TRINITY_DN12438_c1_g3_i2.p1  ORF type:complete len:105 (+),score=14.39 TRINITY_DN12438_c1_g3_i2:106-420(+)